MGVVAARRNPPDQELVIWFHDAPAPHFHVRLGLAQGSFDPEMAWNIAMQLFATLVEYGLTPEE